MSFTREMGGSGSMDSLPPLPGARCATVTMMLAKRLERNEWSVDDEHFFESNTMNVWQALEYLSSVNLRKRYHYDGYNDTENTIQTLTPSWRRDSFSENNDELLLPKPKYTPEKQTSGKLHTTTVALTAIAEKIPQRKKQSRDPSHSAGSSSRFSGHSLSGRQKWHKGKGKSEGKSEGKYAKAPIDYTDLVKCNFNLPRISAKLERLMGTNVVRLTDRNYMKLLRERIEEDYRNQLQSRIQARELKEVERERILIIEGKSHVIPDELADDPIFVVNKDANIEIVKQRAKLKTNRERNAERLKSQGEKWEKERLIHEEEERIRLENLRERRKAQKELEHRYWEEDAERGMDLLRIHNEDWRDCEKELREFLENERAKMKERSLRIPHAFTSDPLDMQNVDEAKKRAKSPEAVRSRIIEKPVKTEMEKRLRKESVAKFADIEEAFSDHKDYGNDQLSLFLLQKEAEDARIRRRYTDDLSSEESNEFELIDQGSTISESKRRHARSLEAEVDEEVQGGLLISKDQYDHLRFEDERILQLHHARDIRELYELAEGIIIGERIEEEPILPEEEEVPEGDDFIGDEVDVAEE